VKMKHVFVIALVKFVKTESVLIDVLHQSVLVENVF
jgi:hypothetical protein